MKIILEERYTRTASKELNCMVPPEKLSGMDEGAAAEIAYAIALCFFGRNNFTCEYVLGERAYRHINSGKAIVVKHSV